MKLGIIFFFQSASITKFVNDTIVGYTRFVKIILSKIVFEIKITRCN